MDTNVNQELLKELNKKVIQLSILEQLRNGELNKEKQITESYETRKNKLKKEIEELEKQKKSLSTRSPESGYIEAHNKLEEIALAPREGSHTTEEELQAMQLYKQARNQHDTTSIINAIESANKLPEASEIKPVLMEAITALNENYFSEKTEEEKAQLNSIFKPEEITNEPTEEEKLLNAYIEAHNRLEEIAFSPREGSYTTPEELISMQVYKQARNLQDTASIINAIESANKLPETSEIKPALIEAITTLNERFLGQRTEEEIAQLNNVFFKEEMINEPTEEEKLLNAYTEAHNRLEEIAFAPREGSYTTQEELQAMQLYKQARNQHDTTSIINAIENANKLSDTSEIKLALIEAITTLNANYLSEKTEEEQVQLNNVFAKEKIINELTEEEKLLNAYTEAHNRLEEIAFAPREGSQTTPEELQAMQLYKQARNQHDTTSIINAMESAYKLPDTSKIKPALIEAITALNANYLSEKPEEEINQLNKIFKQNETTNDNILDKKLEELNKKYEELLKEEEQAKAKYDPMIEEKNKEITDLQQEIKNQKNNIGKEEPELTAEQQQPDMTVMPINTQVPLPEKPLKQEDNETLGLPGPTLDNKIPGLPGPVENKENTIENDIPQVKEPFSIPKVIKSAKQASNELLEKINRFDFKTKKDQVLDWMKNHKKATLVGAAVLATAATAMLGAIVKNIENKNNKNNLNNDTKTTIENETVEPAEANEPEMTEEDKFNAEIQESLNNILNGDQVYSNVYDANNNTNGLNTTQEQRKNSWTNAEATTFYGEDKQLLTRDQAEAVINSGGEVVARFDSNGVPIGYVPVGEAMNNNSGITK